MKRLLFSILCCTIIVFSILVPVLPSASAFSKSWTKDFVANFGRSTYTFTLTSPDEIRSDSNWTITTSLTVDHMDRYKTFLFFSSVIITVETADGKQLKRSLQFGHYPVGEFPDRLYPGGRWGPNNVTINLAEEDLGVPLVGGVDANIYVTVNIAEFLFQPFRVEQRPYTTYETFSVDAGGVRIVSGPSLLTDVLPYVLGLAAGSVVFIGLLMRARLAGRKDQAGF